MVAKADGFPRNPALSSWVCRICVNICLMRLHKGRRAETVPIEEFLPAFTKEGAHAGPVEDAPLGTSRGGSRSGGARERAGDVSDFATRRFSSRFSRTRRGFIDRSIIRR